MDQTILINDETIKTFERIKYKRCHILEDTMDMDLKRLFNNIIEDLEFNSYVTSLYKDWLEEKQVFHETTLSINLITLFYFCMDEILLEFGENARAAYLNFSKARRNRKSYMLQTIKEEYEGSAKSGNSLFLSKQAESFFTAAKVDAALKDLYPDRNTYIDSIYNEIISWKKDFSKHLCEFYFYPSLPLKRRIDLLIVDLSFYILKYIIDKNTGNFDIGLLIFPTNLTDGVFSFKNSVYETEVSVEDDKIINSISYSYEEDGQMVFNKTVVEEIEGDYTSYTTAQAKDELLSSLKEQGKLDDHIRDLSNLEFNVLAHVYSNFTSSILTENRLRFPGKEFCKQVLNSTKLRERDVQKIVKALEKLASVRIETEKRDATGALQQKSIYSFFDLSYGTDTQESVFINNNIINKATSSDSSMSSIDLMGDEWFIDVAPSVYLKDTWRDNKDTYIYSKLYKLVSDKVSEVLTVMFQQLRIQNKETLQADITYTFLRNRLKANGIKLSVLKKDLEKELTTLKNNNVIIKSFLFTKSSLHVDFLPISDIERMVYGIDSRNIKSS